MNSTGTHLVTYHHDSSSVNWIETQMFASNLEASQQLEPVHPRWLAADQINQCVSTKLRHIVPNATRTLERNHLRTLVRNGRNTLYSRHWIQPARVCTASCGDPLLVAAETTPQPNPSSIPPCSSIRQASGMESSSTKMSKLELSAATIIIGYKL